MEFNIKETPFYRYRYRKLREDGFSREWAEELAGLQFGYTPLRLMRKDMRNGLIDESMYPYAWVAWREYRRAAIVAGIWIPDEDSPVAPKKKRRPTDKGNVAAQRKRATERRKAQRSSEIGEVIYNEDTGKFELRYY